MAVVRNNAGIAPAQWLVTLRYLIGISAETTAPHFNELPIPSIRRQTQQKPQVRCNVTTNLTIFWCAITCIYQFRFHDLGWCIDDLRKVFASQRFATRGGV